jgi:hypothetical protein
MDPKTAAYLAKQLVGMVSRDKNVSPDLRRVLGELIGADTKTVTHRRMPLDRAARTLEVMQPNGEVTECDYVTVIDANGKTRHLVFL